MPVELRDPQNDRHGLPRHVLAEMPQKVSIDGRPPRDRLLKIMEGLNPTNARRKKSDDIAGQSKKYERPANLLPGELRRSRSQLLDGTLNREPHKNNNDQEYGNSDDLLRPLHTPTRCSWRATAENWVGKAIVQGTAARVRIPAKELVLWPEANRLKVSSNPFFGQPLESKLYPPKPHTPMARYISFAVLFAILIVIGVLFYKVMIGFFVPVFMAVVLVVVFRPLHRWVLAKVGGRDHVAASITTILIVLIVLLPTALILSLAAVQGAKLFENLNESSIRIGLSKLRANEYINLESPCASQLRSIQSKVQDIQKEVSEANVYDEVTHPQGRLAGDVLEIRNQLKSIPSAILRFHSDKIANQIVENRKSTSSPMTHSEVDTALKQTMSDLQQGLDALTRAIPDAINEPSKLDQLQEEKTSWENRKPIIDRLNDKENQWVREMWVQTIGVVFDTELAAAKLGLSLNELSFSEDGNLARLQETAWQLAGKWQDVRDAILGGRVVGFLKDLANPSSEQVRTLLQNALDYVRPRLISFGGDSAAFIIRLLVGSSILLLALYFFLCDGPGMVRSMMDLSPLDDRYEMELLAEFDRTSRAIVLATILSALAQGITAGLGYYVAGMPSLVMLTALTTVCALIPFFGTAIVWVPVCMYLAVYEERIMAASLLAAWALLVVGTIDNLVKVFILHGQSQLHPLLALLSVLGGIQSLGPIGIVVGPLAVTLLQTTLGIIRHELTEMKTGEDNPAGDPKSKPFSELIRKVKRPDAADQSETESNATESNGKSSTANTTPSNGKWEGEGNRTNGNGTDGKAPGVSPA